MRHVKGILRVAVIGAAILIYAATGNAFAAYAALFAVLLL